MSKVEQLELPWIVPDLPTDKIVGRSREKTWYYLVKPLTDEMVALDDRGEYVFIPHDTIRLHPHLFGTRMMARSVACKMRHVAVWRYKWRVNP